MYKMIHANEPAGVTSRIRMRHGTSCHTFEWVMVHVFVSHHEITAHIARSHSTHVSELWHTLE